MRRSELVFEHMRVLIYYQLISWVWRSFQEIPYVINFVIFFHAVFQNYKKKHVYEHIHISLFTTTSYKFPQIFSLVSLINYILLTKKKKTRNCSSEYYELDISRLWRSEWQPMRDQCPGDVVYIRRRGAWMPHFRCNSARYVFGLWLQDIPVLCSVLRFGTMTPE